MNSLNELPFDATTGATFFLNSCDLTEGTAGAFLTEASSAFTVATSFFADSTAADSSVFSVSSADNVGTFTPSNGAGLVQKAYDRLVEFALRSQPLLRSVADKRPARQSMPGSSVVFQIYSDLSKATTALSEQVDPDSVAIGAPTAVTVVLNEYGNAVLTTRKLQFKKLKSL